MMRFVACAALITAAACGDGGGDPDTGLVFTRDTGVPNQSGDAGPRRDGGAQVQLIQVQSVFDGDTIAVSASFSLFTPDNKPMSGEHIRFLGIDAPEIAHPPAPADCWGPESAAAAQALLQGKTITLGFDLEPSCSLPIPMNRAEACHLRDAFGRLLAYVILSDGRVANEIQLSQGNARSFRAFPHRDTAEYNMLETAAKNADLGMWNNNNCP